MKNLFFIMTTFFMISSSLFCEIFFSESDKTIYYHDLDTNISATYFKVTNEYCAVQRISRITYTDEIELSEAKSIFLHLKNRYEAQKGG